MNDSNDRHATGNTRQLQIQMPPEVQRGVYANNVVVAHTPEEFVLDFIFATQPAGTVNARVVVSPAHAKRIVRTLSENIANYEARFGEIPETDPTPPTAH